MTAPVLDLTELAARADVPVDVVRRYAEAGLLPPARRDGGRIGYPSTEVHTTRLRRPAGGGLMTHRLCTGEVAEHVGGNIRTLRYRPIPFLTIGCPGLDLDLDPDFDLDGEPE